MELTLKMPTNYKEIDEEEMMYLDGGLYFSNGALKSIGWAICSNTYNVYALSNAVKYATAYIGAKLAAITGPVGWAIAGAIGAWVVSNAWTFAERASSALIRGRGVDFYIGWQWCVVPILEGTIR